MKQVHRKECFEKWNAVASAHGPRVAVTDAASGGTWTFSQLSALANAAPDAPPVLASSATGMAFLLDVLRAWRCGCVLLADDAGGLTVPDAASLPAETCHLKVTSGSTGARRMVAFSAEQLVADVQQIIRTMSLHAEQQNVGVISMSHSYGFSNLVLPLLWHGIPLRLAASPLPEAMRAALAGGHPLTLPAVPAMWRAWHQAGVDFRSVRTAISAGAPLLPLSLEQEVHAHCGLKIHNFYGCSECGGIAYDATASQRPEASVAGTAMDGVRLSLRGERLVIHSAAAGLGCVGGEPWEPAIYETGDLARIDAAGQLHLLGRTGETISVAGYKVSPTMVEEALLRVAGVRHCVVFGVPSADAIRQEEVVACIHHADSLTLDDIKPALAHLPAACIPRHWQTCPDLAPDARGKLSRAHWREWWLSRPRRTHPRSQL